MRKITYVSSGIEHRCLVMKNKNVDGKALERNKEKLANLL